MSKPCKRGNVGPRGPRGHCLCADCRSFNYAQDAGRRQRRKERKGRIDRNSPEYVAACMAHISTPEFREHFFSLFEERDGCWNWSNKPARDGYGVLNILERRHFAHRISWAIVNGRLPRPDECVCHSCDNPPCINPAHLWIGTQSDNAHDMHVNFLKVFVPKNA